MSEEVRLLFQLYELPTLDQKFDLFYDYMKSEHHYDAITYATALSGQTVEALLKTTIMKERGMPPEWMRQYITEGLAVKDASIQFVAYTPDPILQTTLFKACDEERLPELYREVPRRVRDYTKSGVVLPVEDRSLRAGIGRTQPT